MKLRNWRNQREPRLMVIPMIDIIFFLLVFFMLNTLYMVEQKVFPVQLPAAKQSDSQPVKQVNITVSKDGEVWIEDKKIILGDFNIDQSLEEWQVFNDYQLINGYQGKWLRTFIEEDGNMNHYSIDNIILSNNIELVAIRNIVTELSDHSLLAAKIRLL